MSTAVTRLTDGPASTESAFTVKGYVVIDIGDKQFMLDGDVGSYINVQYHRSFDEAVSIGTIPQIAEAVAGALGIDQKEFHEKITKDIDNLKVIPGLPAALKKLTIKVTDLGINTNDNKYEFGFCCDLSTAGIKAGGVQLRGFGMKITYSRQPAA
jgi:hypothetical protein